MRQQETKQRDAPEEHCAAILVVVGEDGQCPVAAVLHHPDVAPVPAGLPPHEEPVGVEDLPGQLCRDSRDRRKGWWRKWCLVEGKTEKRERGEEVVFS